MYFTIYNTYVSGEESYMVATRAQKSYHARELYSSRSYLYYTIERTVKSYHARVVAKKIARPRCARKRLTTHHTCDTGVSFSVHHHIYHQIFLNKFDMDLVGINLFPENFYIDNFFNPCFLNLLDCVKESSVLVSKISAKELYFKCIIHSIINIIFEEFAESHQDFIRRPPDILCLENDELKSYLGIFPDVIECLDIDLTIRYGVQ